MTDNALKHIRQTMKIIPKESLTAVVMRHAERYKIPKGEHGNDVLLTERGKSASMEAGRLMEGRISRLVHSPVPRCQQTADSLRQGSKTKIIIEEETGLRCDVYVSDIEAGEPTLWRLVDEKGFYDVFIRQMSSCGENIPYPHFTPPFSGTVEMFQRIIGGQKSGLCLGISHDWLVNVAVAYATGKAVSRTDESYTGYLDALFIWLDDNRWHFYHKGRAGECPNNFNERLTQGLNS